MPSADLSIPKTAKAAVLASFNTKYTIVSNHPVPQPSELQPGQCLIKLEYSGVCHSDLHIMKEDWENKAVLPLIGGHEGVGRVVAIGEHSEEGMGVVKVGDRVGLKWIADACLKCEMCRTGYESRCPTSFARAHGFSVPGTFAEYAVSYTKYVTPIPDELDSAAATPILCAGLTVYKALKQSRTKIGDWVAISGAGGGLGHLGMPHILHFMKETNHDYEHVAVQYAVAMGLRVLAIGKLPLLSRYKYLRSLKMFEDTGDAKKALALSLGASAWVDYKESTDLTKDVHAATDGLGPHAAVIAAGDARPFNQALMYLRATGTLVAVGMPAGNALLNAPVPLLILKCLTGLGSAIGNRQDINEALQIAARGKVKCQYQVRDLSELNEIFDEMDAGTIAGRVLLKF
ncbi:hypothetical protein DXG01_002808 [Tephrocybe rancida]|nr:hypothetical protein DXG01_002808 [Tephrocybe rancida]